MCTIFSVASVGPELIHFHELESVGLVMLCVSVLSPDIDCPITFPFEINLSTYGGTAGETIIVYTNFTT